MQRRLTGLFAAAYTPFGDDGSLNIDPIERMCDLFVAAGVSGVFVCGTTGECHSLTVDERMRVARRWTEVAGDRLVVVVHVGSNSLPDARRLARHAAEHGARAVSSMAPHFFRPADVEQLIDFLAPIAEEAGELPFYYYDIPSMTNVRLPAAEVLKTGSERIPSLAGAKFTDNDLLAYQECLALDDGRFDMLFGKDEFLLAGLALGASGAIGSTYNYAAPVYLSMIRAFREGDLEEARRLQQLSVRLVRALLEFGVVEGGKEIMRMIGVDCGPVRRPLRTVQPSGTRRLRRLIEDLDVFSAPFCPQ